MDAKTIALIVSACTTLLGGAGGVVSYTGWTAETEKQAYAMARYRASKELARACMGEESFDAEWKQVLADIREGGGD